MPSYKLTLPCTRAEADRLAGDISAFVELDPMPALVAHERGEDSGEWLVEAYFEQRPDETTANALRALIPSAQDADAAIEQLDDEDWVTASQAGLDPFRVGRFYIRLSGELAPDDSSLIDLQVDASRAFGTGHHPTTHGCLSALDALKSEGKRFRRIADIGTGTGLLAFAAARLWPQARIVASDIDPVAVELAAEFAAMNGIAAGREPEALVLVAAPGTDHPLIRRRAPYDLVMANILAGPLIALAPDLAALQQGGGTLILAGLIRDQAEGVAAAYRREGYRLVERRDRENWPTLVLRKRTRKGYRRKQRRALPKPIGTSEW
ncbi:50S ribosomal protein L11 methyltransferase [Novosphingopyxis sp.]|uniref:50S ribosomal protein L11 methyltransferase n=1 Tax=Novosphingopyxis sp. TaxID=2709690 RepID=UPI003B5ACE84